MRKTIEVKLNNVLAAVVDQYKPHWVTKDVDILASWIDRRLSDEEIEAYLEERFQGSPEEQARRRAFLKAFQVQCCFMTPVAPE